MNKTWTFLGLIACFFNFGIFAQSMDKMGKLHIVAVENFYGDIANQLITGLSQDQVTVQSILSSEGIDPHEYESTVDDAKLLTKATIVILNGGNYDSWASKILAASPSKNRSIIKAIDVSKVKINKNEHYWYSFDNILNIAQKITEELSKKDVANTEAYINNFKTLKNSFSQLYYKIDNLKKHYENTPIGLIEPIFQYQSNIIGFKILTLPALQHAIEEGIDPSPSVLLNSLQQIKSKSIRIFICNSQTESPLAVQLKEAAIKAGIPVVTVSETVPKNMTYQTWMLSQLEQIEVALKK